MARGIHTRKRSGGPIFRRSVKRTRFVPVRRFRRPISRRVQGQSSRTLNPKAIGQFRTRRTSARAYRRRLYHDTQFDIHWRSVFDSASTVNTPNSIDTSTLRFVNALPNSSGLEFFTTSGGLQPVDTGVAAPVSFGRKITIRGGICYLRVANPIPDISTGGSESIKVTVYAVWSVRNPNFGGFPPAPVGGVPQSWDPSLVPDFIKNIGKIMFRRDFILSPNNSVEEIAFRLRPMKLDRNIFQSAGNQLHWLIQVGQMTNTESTPSAETLTIAVGHNLSFVMDEV